VRHGLFKALFFILRGYLLYLYNHVQDLRGHSKNRNKNPFLVVALAYSLLTLSGFIFLRAYYSKDMILEDFKLSWKLLFFVMLVISLTLTPIYSFRLFFHIFSRKAKFKTIVNQHSINKFKIWATIPLVLFSLVAG